MAYAYIPTSEMVADCLTKAVPLAKHEYLLRGHGHVPKSCHAVARHDARMRCCMHMPIVEAPPAPRPRLGTPLSYTLGKHAGTGCRAGIR